MVRCHMGTLMLKINMLKCSECSKEFKYISEKRRHEQSHIPQFKCKVCCKTFSFLSALRRHEKQHNRLEKVRCNDCGRYFRDETLLNRHTKYSHKGIYACIKCSATFASDTALSTHLKIHNPASERKYRCSYKGCKKAFNFPHHLKHHELTHNNLKQHFCGVCGKGFIQSHHLKSHLRRHESPDNWLMCTVPNCNKKFVTEYSRRRHIAAHNITCSRCGLSMLLINYEDHLINCKINDKHNTEDFAQSVVIVNIKSEAENTLVGEELISPVKEIENYSFKSSNLENMPYDGSNETISNEDISDCKNTLGSCIVSGDSEFDRDCLCAQISGAVKEFSKPTTISLNESVEIVKETHREISPVSFNIKNESLKKICEDSECAEICSKKTVNIEIPNKCPIFTKNRIALNTLKDVLPEIEYRNDGTVKIKEILDFDFKKRNNKKIDIKVERKNETHKNGENKLIPFNSCKAVLGNCIVSGDGTIGEGCLCAKMINNEQPMNEEIEEITPHPNVNIL